MASSSHPRERSIASPKLYDAFISHRGPDVKETLAKQLYHLLQERGCRAFLDQEEIEGGESIPLSIHNGICSSVVQIAIFSERYAESSWCLDELVLMLQQRDALFIPVFYHVQPWELRHIDNEKKRKRNNNKKSQYAAAFSDYERKNRNLDKLDEWKKALATAADISGYELSQHQDNLCEAIVKRVRQEMEKRVPLHVTTYPVGLAELVEYFERSCSKTTGIVGIFGLGGSGKTTLAKNLFNMKRSCYDASCFLSDVRESHARGELHSLQSVLIKDLFGEDWKFKNIDEGIGKLKHRLGRASHLHFLIILDDIDHQDQLDALLPEGMLSSGSLAIITTRDQRVLRGADIQYKMKEMNRDHAKDLFCSHAFRGRETPIAYGELVESFLDFCGGLPLSLKVLGSHVYGGDEYFWKLVLKKAKKLPPEDIMQKLKISFDGLDKEEKQIFIDIACFFNKRVVEDVKSEIIAIWKACGWSAEHAVQILQEKCLIEVSECEIEMHDHLRDLGRQMADELGPPRLWKPEILGPMEAKGFQQILAETNGRCFHSFRDRSLGSDITYFIAEPDLLWLEFCDPNSKTIPSRIPLRKLHYLSTFCLEDIWSIFQQQLQTNTQVRFDLRTLRIVYSRSLLELPDLTEMFSHLEELEIVNPGKNTDMTSFVRSLKQLSNLRSLELSYSFSGENLDLSNGRDSTNFHSSTSSRMTSLETITLSCISNMSKLLISGEICPRLQSLEVEDCEKLETISGLSSLTGIQESEANSCEGLKLLPNFAHLRHLKRIRIQGCRRLQSVEGVEELRGLRSLVIEVPDDGYAWVRNCIYGLTSLPLEITILGQDVQDNASSKLNRNLFSKVIDAQAVVEIERGKYSKLNMRNSKLEMRNSSSTITIYVLLTQSPSDWQEANGYISFKTEVLYTIPSFEGDWITTVLLTQHDSVCNLNNVIIKKGYKATVKVEEKQKALIILRRIVDHMDRMVQKLSAYDTVKRKQKKKH